MKKKFNSLEDLASIKNNLPPSVEPKKSLEEENTEKSMKEDKGIQEKEPKLIVETIIPSITGKETIACWSNKDGNFFTKVSYNYTHSKRWTAVENEGFRGKGLIVFIDKKPKKGDCIKITKVFEKSAVGEVISV